MSISDNYTVTKTLGNGVTTVFSRTWPILAPAFLVVFLENVSTGVQVLQAQGADYTITTDTETSFSITFTTPPPSTENVLPTRVVTQDQTVPYETSKGFQGGDIEGSYDKLTAIDQGQQDDLDRTVKFAVGSTSSTDMPEPVEDKGVKWASGKLVNTDNNIDDAATDAAASAAAALVSENAAAASASAAATSETNAATSETNAAADLVLTNADVVLTGLDVTATNADVVTTNADVVLTGLDVTATNADVVSTGLDVTATNADVVLTNADVVLTNADVVLTGLDVTATGNDVTATNADVVLTNADVVLTGLDVVSTGDDVTATNADVVTTNADAATATAAASAAAIPFTFDSSTSMADPGTGDIRLNNATVSSVTQIAVSALSADSGNPDLSDFIITWDDSTNANRGTLSIKKSGTPATFIVFNITGTITDNGTWLQIPVTYVANNGSLSPSDILYTQFIRTGNDGAGSGNVIGPGSSTDNALARFDSTSGELLQDGQTIEDNSGNVTIAGTVGATNLSGTNTGDEVAATQAQQETGTVTNVYVSPGRQHFHQSAAKMWVNFNGTGTIAIRESYNVTSLTDNGTGAYTVNIATDFSTADYCAVPGATDVDGSNNTGWAAKIHTQAVGSFQIRTGGDGTTNAAANDNELVTAVVFGDL